MAEQGTEKSKLLSAQDFIDGTLDMIRRSVAKPQVAASVLSADFLPREAANKPCAILLTPHPDDECLTAALPLRLKRELGWQIINVAITLGSDLDRRNARKTELSEACTVLGFDAMLSAQDGFSAVNPEKRQRDPHGWGLMVSRIAEILSFYQPQAIFMPHEADAHPTHRGTHELGMDALSLMPKENEYAIFHTEYWQANANANLMIGLTPADAANILSALVCHAGEVARNPYDRAFPSYLIDNVRRGSETIGGIGHAAPHMDFATLYQYGRWSSGKYAPSALKRVIPPTDSPSALFD